MKAFRHPRVMKSGNPWHDHHRRYPPGPSSILPGKLLNQFIRDPVSTLMNIAYEYGEISHFKFGRHHIYLVNDPEQIENILIRDNKNFIKSRGQQVSKRLEKGS
jgi:hypothetical protein